MNILLNPLCNILEIFEEKSFDSREIYIFFKFGTVEDDLYFKSCNGMFKNGEIITK